MTGDATIGTSPLSDLSDTVTALSNSLHTHRTEIVRMCLLCLHSSKDPHIPVTALGCSPTDSTTKPSTHSVTH